MGGKGYREGVADSSFIGPMTMWEDGSNVVRAASATYPLPVNPVGGALAGPGNPTIDSYTSAAISLSADTANQEIVAAPGTEQPGE